MRVENRESRLFVLCLGVRVKNIFWEYSNKSDPIIPSRSVKWAFRVPYIFLVSGSHGWGCFALDVRFLIFQFSHHYHFYTGKELSLRPEKYMIVFTMGFGPYEKSHLTSMAIGISQMSIMEWQIKRIQNRTRNLRMMDKAAKNFKKGRVSAPIDLDKYL